jgi:TRAP-type uncharacterized transport system fused permease subunit
LLRGTPLEVAWMLALSLVGLLALAGGIQGWLGGPTNVLGRVLLIAAGLFAVYPVVLGGWGGASALMLFASMMVWQKIRPSRAVA